MSKLGSRTSIISIEAPPAQAERPATPRYIEWKDVCFLPFKLLWQIVVVGSILLEILWVCYWLSFEGSVASQLFYGLYYAFEALYAIDTALFSTHKFFTHHQRKKQYPSKPYFQLMIDYLTLLPYYEIYYLLELCSKGRNYKFVADVMCWKVMPRIYRFGSFFLSIGNTPGLNHAATAVVAHGTFYALFIVIGASVWHYFTGESTNWASEHLQYHDFNRESGVSWFVICCDVICGLFAHNWSGVIMAVRGSEFAAVIATALLGHLVHHMILFGTLTTIFVNRVGEQFRFTTTLHAMQRLMADWAVPPRSRRDVVSVYNNLWERRAGVKECPNVTIEALPLVFRKDVALDVFWPALKHLPLFEDLDMPVKRNLALRVRNRFLAPGELVLRAGKLRSKMVYVASGIIQILSKDVESSPILSFSAGTIIGETSPLILLSNTMNVVSATYCEIQELGVSDVLRVLNRYRTVEPLKRIRFKLSQRLNRAEVLREPALLSLKKREQSISDIKWFKHRWRHLYFLSKHVKNDSESAIYHTSKNFGLYVLSDEVELKRKIICLKSKFPCIFAPDSDFVKIAEYVVLTSIVIQLVLTPYMICFASTANVDRAMYAVFYLMDVIFFFGFLIDISTAIKKPDRFLATLGTILVCKGKQVSFLLEFLALIPWEILMPSDDLWFHLFKCNRLLKVYKIFVVIFRAELNVWVNYIWIRSIKYLTILAMAIYFFTALEYVLANFPEPRPTSWLHYNNYLRTAIGGDKPLPDLPPIWLAAYYALKTLLAQSWRSYYAYSIPDMVVEIIIVTFGYFLYAFCVAEIGACSILKRQSMANYQAYLSTLTKFVYKKGIPVGLKTVMYDMVRCQWEYNRRFVISGERSIIRDLPQHLRNDVLVSRIVQVLKSVPIFMDFAPTIIWRIASKMSINIFPPDTVLVREDCFTDTLCLIIRGHCVAVSHVPTDKYHAVEMSWSTGDAFPILEVFMRIDSFLRVTAKTHVEIASVSFGDLMDALNRESEFYKNNFLTLVDGFFVENQLVLGRLKGRLPEMVAIEKGEQVTELFAYVVNDRVVKFKKKIYEKNVWARLGFWKFLRHLMFASTIDPLSKQYICWECFRCLVALFNCYYCFFVLRLYRLTTVVDRRQDDIVLWTVFFIGLLDSYIRSHCCYFDLRTGVLITHPLKTFRHYWSTSFASDLIGVFPFHVAIFDHMFSARSYYLLYTVVIIASRMTGIYRVFYGITYLEGRSIGRAVAYNNLKYAMIIVTALAGAAALLRGATCVDDPGEGGFRCPNDTWVRQAGDGLYEKNGSSAPTTVALICFYAVAATFTTGTVGAFRFDANPQFGCVVVLSLLLTFLRIYLLVKITCSRIGGNTVLVHYQHNMKEFIKFSRHKLLERRLVNETVAHFEYVWKHNKGSTTSTILRSFHPVLRSDFCSLLYEPTVRMTEALANSGRSAIAHLSPMFDERHYRKGSEVVRCNDVSRVLYVVHRGSVEVTIANDRLAILTKGAMFGCFDPRGRTRLTINVKATVHVDLLAIDTKLFYRVIERYKPVVNRMTGYGLVGVEYMTPASTLSSVSITSVPLSVVVEDQTPKPIWKRVLTFVILPSNKYLRIYNYVINVHFSVLVSLAMMTLVVKVGTFDISNYWYVGYIFDCVFLSKIYLGFHEGFVDQESGVIVKTYSKIWRSYIRSRRFWWNLFLNAPLEIAYYVYRDPKVYRYCWCNRVFRFVYLISYYNNSKNTLTVSKHLQWTYLIYSTLLLIHTNACIWWRIGCYNETCHYYPKLSHEEISLKETEDVGVAFRLAYVYAVNIFTAVGLQTVIPTDFYTLITTIFLMFCSQIVNIALAASFASVLFMGHFEMVSFERGAWTALRYFDKLDLCIYLKRKVWNYYVEQWTKAHGQWIPELIGTAPAYLKEDMMLNLYSKHLSNHVLFRKTHVDFIRQLTVHLKLEVYLPDMYVVHTGDIDGRMYFVEDGEIVGYNVIYGTEIGSITLGAGSSFGETQCLYDVPHDRSYKALYTTKVLSLKRGTWEYLMDWFPASKEQIFEEAAHEFKP